MQNENDKDWLIKWIGGKEESSLRGLKPAFLAANTRP
jgi:hypothetical protein